MAPQILYSIVARGNLVLAEYSDVTGNANLVAHRILDKLPDQDTRVSYSQGQHLFHCLVSGGLAFVCMADESLGRRIPFAFLEDIKDRFVSMYGAAALAAVAYEYNTEFSLVLKQRADFFNKDPSADTIGRVRGEVTEVKNIMVENIEKVLERGERLELLVDKTDHLQHQSLAFKREARGLKNKMWWKNIRVMCAIALVILLVIYIIAAFFCGLKLHC